jgi:hypothetical protein
MAHGGDSATPKGQNPTILFYFILFFAMGWPATTIVAKGGGSVTPVLFLIFFNFF